MTVLRDRIAELRPVFVPPDPCQRIPYRPDELAQFDLWQPDALIPVGHGQAEKLWLIVGARGCSKLLAGWMIPSREAHDVLDSHLEVLRQFRSVPRLGVPLTRWRPGSDRTARRSRASARALASRLSLSVVC